MTEQAPLQSPPRQKRRTLDEIYNSVVEGIRKQYNYEISDKEAHEAARNLLGFCQKLVDLKLEQVRKQE